MQDSLQTPWRQRFASWLASLAVRHRRWWPWAIAGVAMVLCLPSLTIGWIADDYAERWVALHDEPLGLPGSIAGMQNYVSGDPANHQYLVEHGVVPLWSSPDMKLCFWRPLAEVTQWLDYQLWPDDPVFIHAHGIGWYGLLVFVACLAYRRLLSPAAGFVAALAFAVEPTHGVPVGWISDRYALIAPMFGVAAFAAHAAWRKERDRKWAGLAWGSFALALLSGEIGVAALGYLAGYAVFVDRGSRKQRLLSLVPYLVLAGAWLVARSALGFGSRGVPPYIDPVHDPLAFVAALPERGLDLFVAQWYLPVYWLRPPADQGGGLVVTLVSLVLAVAVLAVIVPQLRRCAMSRALAAGMFFSLVPPAVTAPSERHLVMASFGAMALLGQVIHEFLVAPRRPPKATTAVVGILALSSFVVGPVRLAAQLPLQARTARTLLIDPMLRIEADGAGNPRTWIVLSASRGFTKLPLIRQAHGLTSGHRVWVLADPRQFTSLHRVDHDLIVATAKQTSRAVGTDTTSMTLDGLTVERVGDSDGVVRVEYRFTGGVDDPRFRWMIWKDGVFVEVAPPSLGEVVALGRG